MNEAMSMLQTPAPHTLPATPPLMQRLVSVCDASWVREESLQDFLATPGDAVLFIAGDPVRFPECLDVAVILPELHIHFGRRFAIGVAERASEDALGKRYGAMRRPSLVFLRDGQYVTTVAGMLDWDVYLAEVDKALSAPVSRAPTIGIPVVTANSGTQCQ
jgi:hydrogenase-1 operon protein HyaE